MLKLSIRDIKNGYAGIKEKAKAAAMAGCYEESLSYIQHCVILAQQFNWIYSDNDLEFLVEQISSKCVKPCNYIPQNKRVVFFDDFCRSFVLAIQYLDALKFAGYEVLYVSTKQNDLLGRGLIYDKLTKYDNVTIYKASSSTNLDVILEIREQINHFCPSKILLHCYAYSTIIPVLYSLPKETKSYYINLADQTFWLGSQAIDYVLEFRQFGVSVSQQRRGICPEQQLLIPFYPIVDNNPFLGFPKECTEEGKVLIFSGCDMYKVLDEKRMFWHLIKRILDTFPEVVFFFATKSDEIGMSILQDFIHTNHFEGRFIHTKFRPDINEILAHVDIYMGSCPASGSLMSQLAARNATPILQYYYPGTPDDETEQAICINEQFQISFQDEEAFMLEAERLIHDVSYRHAQGKRLQNAMMDIDYFNQLVEKTLLQNKTQVPLKPYEINYALLDARWYALEKQGYIHSIHYIYSLLGKKDCIRFAPSIFVKKQINTILTKIQDYESI